MKFKHIRGACVKFPKISLRFSFIKAARFFLDSLGLNRVLKKGNCKAAIVIGWGWPGALILNLQLICKRVIESTFKIFRYDGKLCMQTIGQHLINQRLQGIIPKVYVLYM